MMKTGKIVLLGLLCSIMLILGYIESMIVIFPGIPGIKPGFANCALLFALSVFKKKDALLLALLKVGLSALLFGNVESLVYSASGTLCAMLSMIVLSTGKHFGTAGISVGGAVAHMIGQLLASILMLGSFSGFLMAPWLMVCALVSGIVTGIATEILIRLFREKIAKQVHLDEYAD